MNAINTVFDWFQSLNIHQKEIDILTNEQIISSNDKSSFKSLLYNQILDNQYISFDDSATKIIDRLFNLYVNDDTLVITSSSEHPSVYNNLIKCKNVIKLFTSAGYNYSVNIERELEKYKKVFVYIIGTSSGDNFQCSNFWFVALRNILIKYNKPHVFVIDAVQELFMLPRDYSIFDYVIGTAHAIIPWYNRGIVISKNSYFTNQHNDNQLFLMLSIIQKYKDKFTYFQHIMQQEFSYELMTDKNLSINTNSPFIFNLLDRKCRLYGVNDEMFIPDHEKINNIPATFRAFPAFIWQNKFKQMINKTHVLLKNN